MKASESDILTPITTLLPINITINQLNNAIDHIVLVCSNNKSNTASANYARYQGIKESDDNEELEEPSTSQVPQASNAPTGANKAGKAQQAYVTTSDLTLITSIPAFEDFTA